jgi:hypothetical protein
MWVVVGVMAAVGLAGCGPGATSAPSTEAAQPASATPGVASVTPAPASVTPVVERATPTAEVDATEGARAPASATLSDQAVFRAWYVSEVEPPPVNDLHAWTLHVETAAGAPVEEASIRVAGDMPAHGHGLPTQPQVTEYLGGGDYRVEGMKFSMGGEWVITFEIEAGALRDSVSFDLTLE